MKRHLAAAFVLCLVVLAGCGGGGGGGSANPGPPPVQNTWDDMNWDAGQWA